MLKIIYCNLLIFIYICFFRAKEQATQVVREGPTYVTNIAVEQPDADISNIPAPTPTDSPKVPLKDEDQQLIFFDLETTSLSK